MGYVGEDLESKSMMGKINSSSKENVDIRSIGNSNGKKIKSKKRYTVNDKKLLTYIGIGVLTAGMILAIKLGQDNKKYDHEEARPDGVFEWNDEVSNPRR